MADRRFIAAFVLGIYANLYHLGILTAVNLILDASYISIIVL